LNLDLRPVLQHARVSSPNAGASNVFISGIPYALDSYWQFTTSGYAVSFRTQQQIPIPPSGTEEIVTSLLSQNRTLRGYLRDRLDSVREIATVTMDEPDDGMNLAIFNASGLVRRLPIGGCPQFISHSKVFTCPCASLSTHVSVDLLDCVWWLCCDGI
jgi:hypothetical protein